jgi:hypothetical protein
VHSCFIQITRNATARCIAGLSSTRPAMARGIGLQGMICASENAPIHAHFQRGSLAFVQQN